MKKFLVISAVVISVANLALFSINGFAQTSVIIPNLLNIDSAKPAQAFPTEVQQLFTISSDSPSNACLTTQPYRLTMFIHRNAVDKKFVAIYRSVQEKETCWVNLTSHSTDLNVDFKAGGWNIPKFGANTWCSAAGLRDPNLCPVNV